MRGSFDLSGRLARSLRRFDHRLQTDPASVLIAASTVYFILWACAPPTTFPTVVPLGDHGQSVTLGVTAGAIPPHIEANPAPAEAAVPEAGNVQDETFVFVDSQFSYYAQIFKIFDVGIMAGGGMTSLFFGGVMVRPRFETRNFSLGLQLDGGFLWGGALLPAAVRIGPDLWLHGTAGIRVGTEAIYWVPMNAGVQYGAWKHGDILLEIGSRIVPGSPEANTIQGTLGVRFRFGRLIPRPD